MDARIKDLTARDIRFPTSLQLDGSDAMHTDPDYSAAYVTLETDSEQLQGHGLTFTCGRGTEVCVAAIEALKPLITGRSLSDITADMGAFWRELTSDSQLRWLGPEKGVIHLATGAVLNALWDLWAKAEGKPVWKLVVDMTPAELVGCIDFRYMTDALTTDEALAILQRHASGKAERESEMLAAGYPAYTTSTGWLGYPDDKLRRLCEQAVAEGWSHIKMKVGQNIDDDIRRVGIARQAIGAERKLMIDANQVWDVPQAIDWVNRLAQFDLWWIEEPTSPDDVLGHATIRRGVQPVGVATGEHCQNRTLFKQFFQAQAIDFCQLDACRLGSVNEALAVMLMAAKFNVPVCPHAGGVGLCEYVQHLSIIDYVCISASLENRVTEYVDHLHEHFVEPCVIRNCRYMPPSAPGYSITMKQQSLDEYEFPSGVRWADRL